MINNLYVIKDLKSTMQQPWIAKNDGEATRALQTAVESKQGIIGEHPTDVELWQVGTFDDITGELKNELKYICAGKDFVKSTNLTTLDEQTLKKVLDELIKISEEQERERQAFVEVKDKLHIADTKFANIDKKIENLNKTKMNKLWGKK